MLAERLRRSGPRRTLIATVVVLLCAVLGWLASRLVEQETSQRLVAERDIAADLVVAAFERRFNVLERDLDAVLSRGEAASAVPSDMNTVLVRISGGRLDAWPGQRLRYYPDPPPAYELSDAGGSAEALANLAGEHLKNSRYEPALAAYEQLAALGAEPVNGIPAAYAALWGQMAVFRHQNDVAALKRTAAVLDESLRTGRWPVSHATYAALREEWLGPPPAPDPHITLAEAAEWLWERRSDPFFPISGRAAQLLPSGPTLIVWRGSAEHTVAMIVGPEDVKRTWVGGLQIQRQVDVAITTPEGQPIIGSVPSPDRSAVRLASGTTLPWTIHVTNRNGAVPSGQRRQLLFAGMVVLFGLIATAAWLIERTVTRQLAIAELQSDFVSAVSHEFRTPLTTLCQLTELLVRNRVATADDRRQYYELLHHESHRLRRLVETLLNFGRLEAGRMEFRFETLDVVPLVHSTVSEFAVSTQARGHRVELDTGDRAAALRGDREVLRTLIWNLLENAAKYSPDCDVIWVRVQTDATGVNIAVRDRGVGIPRAEQRQVFDKFVRGSLARSSDVGGTGVGLAMARRIAEAHGGDITLESEPGAGSTFTVILPAVDSQLPPSNSQAVVAAG